MQTHGQEAIESRPSVQELQPRQSCWRVFASRPPGPTRRQCSTCKARPDRTREQPRAQQRRAGVPSGSNTAASIHPCASNGTSFAVRTVRSGPAKAYYIPRQSFVGRVASCHSRFSLSLHAHIRFRDIRGLVPISLMKRTKSPSTKQRASICCVN